MVRASSGLLGLIGTALGLGRLTGDAERRDAAGGARTLGKEAGASLSTTVELAFDVTRPVKTLQVLHMDVPQTSVIEEEIFLGRREILVILGQDLHVEDLGKMIGRT